MHQAQLDAFESEIAVLVLETSHFCRDKVFIGVILNMGLVQLSLLKDYWLTHETLNLQIFHIVFSRDHILQLLCMLHVREVDVSIRCSKHF